MKEENEADRRITGPTKRIRLLAVTTVVIWIVQYLCYESIVEDAASSAHSRTASSSSRPLAGGVALDALALVTVVQFAGLLWSRTAYYGLALLPVGAAVYLFRSAKNTWASLASSSPGLSGSVPAAAASNASGSSSSRARTRRGGADGKMR
jgi:hypothetical protein